MMAWGEGSQGVSPTQGRRRWKLWLLAEGVAWALGAVCLLVVGTSYVAGVAAARDGMKRFALRRATPALVAAKPDQSLWSRERIRAWHAAIDEHPPTPLAVLRIPRIRLEAPVLEGTGALTLNGAVGHIEDTAAPGTDGNSGIAGHRDGFFRGLKDIEPGDIVEIETLRGTEAYRVERAWIVDPEDVSVLSPTLARSVTLVTCYPFYFIGSAPQRFIVRAVLANTEPAP